MTAATYKTHPAAEIFPLLEGANFEALVQDIRNNGLREAITLHPDGSVLDGRNRLRACRALAIEPLVSKWDGSGTEAAFVVSKNLHRRHLDETQRAMVATTLATRKREDNLKQNKSTEQGIPCSDGLTNQQAADLLNVSADSVIKAKKVFNEATAEIIESVRKGEISLNAASRQIGKPTKSKPSTRVQTQKQNARLWRQFRDGLEAINGLPDFDTMIKNVPAPQRGLVSRRLPVVRAWLENFELAWNQKQEAQDDSQSSRYEAS